MRLLHFISDFFNGPDLTRQWIEMPMPQMEFDFDSGSLCGVCLGSSFDKLSWLGPAECRRKYDSRNSLFVWYSKGLWIKIRDESFVALTFWFQSPSADQTEPFSGRFAVRGRSFQSSRPVGRCRVETLMGEPTTRRMFDDVEDAVETLLYQISDRGYLFDFDADGNLCSLSASNRTGEASATE